MTVKKKTRTGTHRAGPRGGRPLLLRGGHLVDPVNGRDGRFDIVVRGDEIAEVGEAITLDEARVIDVSGKTVTPGLVDIHVHLREPGREDQETIETGCQAAAAGGFTSVVCMPNTQPPVDHPSVVELIVEKAREKGSVGVYVAAAVSKGLAGEELSEMADLVRAGAVAFTDDGRAVADAELMRRALEYSSMLGVPIVSHAEEPSLTVNGQVNEGYHATLLGLKGMPDCAEEVIVARDLILAEATGGRVHFAHLSTAGSVELVRRAKERGTDVTCEATPHHLLLTDEVLTSFNANFKVNPPLRTDEDREALLEGVSDGTIDVVASDHAPHARSEKEREFDYAPFGMVGLETTATLVLTHLVGKGVLSLPEAVRRLSVNPARIMGIDAGAATPGKKADLTVLDLDVSSKVDSAKFESKSENTPFEGWPVKGLPVGVLVGGRIEGDLEIDRSG